MSLLAERFTTLIEKQASAEDPEKKASVRTAEIAEGMVKTGLAELIDQFNIEVGRGPALSFDPESNLLRFSYKYAIAGNGADWVKYSHMEVLVNYWELPEKKHTSVEVWGHKRIGNYSFAELDEATKEQLLEAMHRAESNPIMWTEYY